MGSFCARLRFDAWRGIPRCFSAINSAVRAHSTNKPVLPHPPVFPHRSLFLPVPCLPSGTRCGTGGFRQWTQSAEKKSLPFALEPCCSALNGSKFDPTRNDPRSGARHDTAPASRVSNMQGRAVSTALIVAPDCWRRATFPILLHHPENSPLHTHVARALASLVHRLCISRSLHAEYHATGHICQAWTAVKNDSRHVCSSRS